MLDPRSWPDVPVDARDRWTSIAVVIASAMAAALVRVTATRRGPP